MNKAKLNFENKFKALLMRENCTARKAYRYPENKDMPTMVVLEITQKFDNGKVAIFDLDLGKF